MAAKVRDERCCRISGGSNAREVGHVILRDLVQPEVFLNGQKFLNRLLEYTLFVGYKKVAIPPGQKLEWHLFY